MAFEEGLCTFVSEVNSCAIASRNLPRSIELPSICPNVAFASSPLNSDRPLLVFGELW